MVVYTAEDGLKVLNYLGLIDLSDRERDVFRERWNEFYEAGNDDLVMATWTLYASALPYICGNDDRYAFMIAQKRDHRFGERIENTELYKKLKDNIPLNIILNDGSPSKAIK